MWYLVAPPIVVVLSLSFLVWYLSRKGDDPTIAEKVLANGTESESISFPRTKEFFLRILEKAGQRFKVGSLRAHNALHEFTQSVKASRIKVRMAVTEKTAPVTEEVPTEVLRESESVSLVAPAWAQRKEKISLEHFMTKGRDGSPEALLTTPIVRERRTETKVSAPINAETTEGAPRPMVSATATHPEQKKSFRPDVAREENLIARIARDPKDFTAYEELGDYYLEAGNIKDAKECYRQVLKLSPVHRMVKIKIRRLEKLLGRVGV